ncbi:MAG TPA: TIGR02266 family protein, partial [Myxococcus sp.]|nr:TIGR02266 family protein [Myxococcus sp.]
MKLKHETVGSFAEEFATNLSPGGMFVRSRTPQAVGTPVKFEVQIANGTRVLRGAAVVRWVREVGDPAGPPGMGLQFEELDPASRALVDMMLQKRKPDAPAPALAPLPGIAPVVAPVAPLVPPVQARPAPAAPPVQARPAPAPRAAGGMALDSLFDDLEAPDGPSAPLADEPFSIGPPPVDEPQAPEPYAPPPPASDDVDIPLDELIASTPPPPAPADDDEPLPGLDFELESPSADVPLALGQPLDEPPIEVGLSVEFEPPSAPAASRASGPVELDLDLTESVEEAPRAAAAPKRASSGPVEFDLDLSE